MQRFRRPRFIFFVARAHVACTGRAADHQYAHGQKARECFSNKIDNRADFTRHALDEVLSNKEHRLDCPNRARARCSKFPSNVSSTIS